MVLTTICLSAAVLLFLPKTYLRNAGPGRSAAVAACAGFVNLYINNNQTRIPPPPHIFIAFLGGFMPLKSAVSFLKDIFGVSPAICRKRAKSRVCAGVRFCGFAGFGFPQAVCSTIFYINTFVNNLREGESRPPAYITLIKKEKWVL
jgi:hypothetical protein